MLIQIASDLHLDVRRAQGLDYLPIVPAPGAEVLVLAGDIDRHTHMLDHFADWPVPVVYVHGNHEAYDAHYFGIQQQLGIKSEGTQVHYLEKKAWVHNGVRFLGCCLWTDYQLYGTQAASMDYAKRMMPDDAIKLARGESFKPKHALMINQDSIRWLYSQLLAKFDGPTVVVTHHAPHPNSIHPDYAGSELNPAFCSDFTKLVRMANVWIHGHTHNAVDYWVDDCRVVSNPLGYSRVIEDGLEVPQNLAYHPALLLDV